MEETPETTRPICCWCGDGEDDELGPLLELGPLADDPTDEVEYVHEGCADRAGE